MAKDLWHDGDMAIKNLLDEVKNALSIAQAGMQGTLKSLKNVRSKAKKRTASKSTSKKKAQNSATTKPKKTKRERNPSKLVIVSRDVVPRKPSKQKPAKKSKSKYWP
jgi:hypothetical protein